MSLKTKYYNLQKDNLDDYYDINVFNSNFDKIDSALNDINTLALDKDGGNANTLQGKSVGDFVIKTNRHISIENTDFNDLTDTGVYDIGTENNSKMSEDKNQPVGAYQWGSLVVLDSGIWAKSQVYYSHTGEIWVRGRYGDDNWNGWERSCDGGNAKKINQIVKNFTVKKGSWFRLAKCRNALSCGAFILEVGSNASCSSISMFSVSQSYSSVDTGQNKITEISHSSFGSCVTKVRLGTKYGTGNEQYIDFYIENGENDSEGYAIIQFFGQGWEICNIETTNIAEGYTQQILEL